LKNFFYCFGKITRKKEILPGKRNTMEITFTNDCRKDMKMMHPYLKEIKEEFPNIKPFENDDLERFSQAMDLLKEQNYEEAEVIFKKLCFSQPDHHDGFEGLALIFYRKGEFEKANWFMQEAIKKAAKFLDDEKIDPEIIEEMKNAYQKMLLGERLEFAGDVFEPLAERVSLAEDAEQWYEQYYSAPFKLRYRMLMETLEHPLPFTILDEKEVGLQEELEEQQKLQELCFSYVQLLLENKKMGELRLLLEKFRRSQPELYRKDYNYYDQYLVQIALFQNEKEKVIDYLDIFIEDPVSGIDELIVVLQLLQYYGLPEQAEFLSRKVYQTIRDDKELIPGGELYFEDTILLTAVEKIYYRLQQGDRPTREEINEELQKFDLSLEQDIYDGLLFQLAPGNDRKKVGTLVQAKTEKADSILNLLNWQFCKYLLERKRFSFVTGGILFYWLTKTFKTASQGNADSSEDISQNGAAGQGLPAGCFVFRQESFQKQLQNLGGFLSNQWPQVAGLLWGAPYLYEFLHEYDLITADELERAQGGLNGLRQQFIRSHANDLWKYSFVQNWPPPDSISGEAWAAEKERFNKSFSETPEQARGKTGASAASGQPLSEAKTLPERKKQVAAKTKKQNKQKHKRKEARKQRRKRRK
jgi:hypothetical protein